MKIYFILISYYDGFAEITNVDTYINITYIGDNNGIHLNYIPNTFADVNIAFKREYWIDTELYMNSNDEQFESIKIFLNIAISMNRDKMLCILLQN